MIPQPPRPPFFPYTTLFRSHNEDVAAWELLWDARQAYARAADAVKQERGDAPTETALKEAFESLLAAEGSDWCWWFGPERSEEHTSELQSRRDLVCRLLLEK